jgi:hypothetical protein
MVESAFSEVPSETAEWMTSAVHDPARSIVFTHTPVDVPEVREFILSVNPRKDLKKYVTSKSPKFFLQGVQGRASWLYAGHLHFGGTVTVAGTSIRFLGLSTEAEGVRYEDMGEALVLDLDRPSEPRIIRL